MTEMDDKALRRLLRRQRTTNEMPGKWCPDESQIAAYVEHRLPAKEEARVEAHVADCDACLAQVAFFVRGSLAPAGPVAPQLLERARNLVPDKRKVWSTPVLRWGAVAATAACFVLVVSYELRTPGVRPAAQPPGPDASALVAPATVSPAPSGTASPAIIPEPARPARQEVRNAPGKPLALEVLFPSENASLSPKQLEIRWQEVPSTAYYEVYLVTEDGAVLWQSKVDGTRARLPDSVSLEKGGKYFVWIRAYLSGGGTVKSSAVSFRIGGL